MLSTAECMYACYFGAWVASFGHDPPMHENEKRVLRATKLATAAMSAVIDIEADRETQLLALTELAYRVQVAIESIEAKGSPEPTPTIRA